MKPINISGTMNSKLPSAEWLREHFATDNYAVAANAIRDGIEEVGEKLVTFQSETEEYSWIALVEDVDDPNLQDVTAGLGKTLDEAIVALDYLYYVPINELGISLPKDEDNAH